MQPLYDSRNPLSPPGRAESDAAGRKTREEEAGTAAVGAAAPRAQVSAPRTDGRSTAGGEVLGRSGQQRCIDPVYFGESMTGVSHGCYQSVACPTVNKTIYLASAAYPRLQGYWGNQARIRGLPGVGSQDTPTKN